MRLAEYQNIVHGTRPSSNDYAEIRSGWRFLVAAMLGTGLGFPTLVFYTIGIFAPTLAQEFGWSFANIFAGFALIPVAVLIGGPLVGHLVDRYGARIVAAISLAALGVSYMTFALSSHSIARYYATWIAVTVAGMGTTPVSFTSAVNGVFVRRRGLALGITLAGIGLFAWVVKPLAAWLLQVGSWREAVLTIGLLPLVIGMPLVLWAFPAARSGAEGSGQEAIHRVAQRTGLTVREALRTRAFWLIVLAFVPIAFAIGGPLPNMENILKSLHVKPSDIVTLTSLIGVTIVAGRLLGGWLMDRVWAPAVGAMIVLAAAVACCILSLQVVSHYEAMLAAALLGFAAGLEVDLLAYLVARYIGLRSYGGVYGTVYGLFAVGAGMGPSLLGLAYDRTGSYSQIMQMCSLLLVIAACLLICLGRYPDPLDDTADRDRAGGTSTTQLEAR